MILSFRKKDLPITRKKEKKRKVNYFVIIRIDLVITNNQNRNCEKISHNNENISPFNYKKIFRYHV